jgi:NAD(P)H-quinone oxidoreductase subunit 4L
MLPRSSIIALIFVAIATVLVCAYAYNFTPQILGSIQLDPKTHIDPTLADVVTTGLLLIAAIVCILLGGDVPMIMLIGTMGVFVSLTLAQSELIRYMTLSALLFCMGMYGMVVSRNAVRVLISIELMLNAVNINMVALSRFVDPVYIKGQVFAVFILTVAAAEAAVGLAIVLACYRNMSTVDMEKFNILKW